MHVFHQSLYALSNEEMVNHERVNVHFHDHYYPLEFHFDDDNNDPTNVDYEFSRSNME